MKDRLLRIYVDTSVLGGCFDLEFEKHSRRLMLEAENEKIIVVISQFVLDELVRAPEEVRQTLNAIPKQFLEVLQDSDAVAELADAYLIARVLPKHSRVDALHVAHATVARVDAIVSWNFQDIVRLDRMKGFNRVNLERGYGFLEIISPREVLLESE